MVTESNQDFYNCEATTYRAGSDAHLISPGMALEFRRRRSENTGRFNVAMLIPTGIGAAIGGHAGDATPVAQLMASVSDNLVLHPNVVNASDINEMPANALYIEGSVLCRLIMGTVGLHPVRANQVLVLLHPPPDRVFPTLTFNSVHRARSSSGPHFPL